MAKPLSNLLNNIVLSADWPKQWKVEYTTPIGKIPQPESEDDLRPIALTFFFSKVIEQYVVMWLLEIIGDKFDFRQYGGMNNQDNTEATAVLVCLVDFSKAFNRQDHSILITKLSDMGTPSWLLNIVIAFLKDRCMVVKYKWE